MMKRVWDTHCHLNDPVLFEKADTLIKESQEAGLEGIVVPSYDLASIERTRQLADKYHDFIYPAAGIHPAYTRSLTDLEFLKKELLMTSWAAIGEIGLDYWDPETDKDLQEKFFIEQVDLAATLHLPVLLHCRKAHERLYTILNDLSRDVILILHAYSGGWETAKKLMKFHVFFSFCGTVCLPNARKVHESARNIPLDRILIETDAPCIATNARKAGEMTPEHVTEIAEALANIRGLDFDEIADITSRTASHIFCH